MNHCRRFGAGYVLSGCRDISARFPGSVGASRMYPRGFDF